MRAVFILALVASLALNVWLIVRERAALDTVPSSAPLLRASAPLPTNAAATGAASGEADARKGPELASVARAIAASKGARPESGRVVVDANMVSDAQCRVAREKAAEAWRREGDGIRNALVAYQEPTEVERATQLQREQETLADVVGAEPDDARVRELAERRMALKGETNRRWKESLTGEPPDWRTGVDVLIDYYRKSDAESLRIFGEEKAADVRVADLEERAALLAIGASLVDEPWDATLKALEP